MYASGQSAILGTPPQMRTAPRVERSTLANLVGSAEQGCACRSVSGKAHVRKRLGDERERAPGQAQHEWRSLSVLNVGWLGFEDQATAIRVHYDLPLAPVHLLARIVAARTTALGRLHGLAVEHGGARRRLAPDPLPVRHDQEAFQT